MPREARPATQTLLAELGLEPRLIIYLAGAPGAGKTHRLLSDARLQASAGRRVAIGWIETKGRRDLDTLAAALPRIPPRRFAAQEGPVEDFDLDAALASDFEMFVLDELAHHNPSGAPNEKRWQDALVLRTRGRSVLAALDVEHLATVAPIAERILGHPVPDIVPISFLKEADGVVALDVSPSVLESRLRTGRIVVDGGMESRAARVFAPENLKRLRELLLRTLDDLTIPVLSPSKSSTALAIVEPGIDAAVYLQRVERLADALDLALEVTALKGVDLETLAEPALAAEAGRISPPPRLQFGRLDAVMASVVAVPPGRLALRILRRPLDRMLYIADPTRRPTARAIEARHPYDHAAGDRMRIGYGKLTVFFGALAGSGKTYAMLDRAQQLRDDGIDVVAALVETHGHADTEMMLTPLEAVPRLGNGEVDLSAVLARHPRVALVDELAHRNAPGSEHQKRYDDVISLLRAGIDVLTTLNVHDLEGVGEAVVRLTGERVADTLPDAILDLADDIVFVDQTLQVRIAGPAANVAALRELAIREVAHARGRRRGILPFDRILLGVAPRTRDVDLVERMGHLASRLDIDLRVVLVATGDAVISQHVVEALTAATQRTHGTFALERGTDPAKHLVKIAKPLDVLAVESPRTPRRAFSRESFALQLLKAGARELLVIRPSNL